LGIATLLLGFYVVSDTLWSLANGQAVSGYATIIISLGIIGEYIAKIYEGLRPGPIIW
jgi:polyisoprenyl-phosphate glycosyltransferase